MLTFSALRSALESAQWKNVSYEDARWDKLQMIAELSPPESQQDGASPLPSPSPFLPLPSTGS